MMDRGDVGEFANRPAVDVPGWDEPMVPITREERGAILVACEAYRSKEALRAKVNSLAPPGNFEAFQQPLRVAIEILSEVGGPERAIYSVVRIATAYAIVMCGPEDWRARKLSSLMAALEQHQESRTPRPGRP